MAAGNILRIVQSDAFQEIHPLTLDKATEQSFLVHGNDGRPTLHAAGINGQLSGHRAVAICYDDLTKSLSDAYSEAVRERTWMNFNSCAETRLLPQGHIYGIQTRWSLDDTHGRLLARAMSNPYSRQFTFLNLAARNDGTQSYILNTKTKEKQYLKPYASLATKEYQSYSFSSEMLRGKEADLGPTVFSALYMGQPVSQENQMFPPENWSIHDGNITTDDVALVVTSWDTASRTKATNDPSNNTTILRLWNGKFIVVDNVEMKLTMDKLLPVVLERYRVTCSLWNKSPVYLAIEEKDSGVALIDIIAATFPELPLLRAKAVKSKIVRAESVTPFTAARSVSLLKGDWNLQFITYMANFPASDRDHATDSFCHGMRAFTGTGGDFQKPNVLPAPPIEEKEEFFSQLMDGFGDGGMELGDL